MLLQKEIIEKMTGIKNLFTESYNSEGMLTHRLTGKVKTESDNRRIIFYEDVQWRNESSLLINSKNIYHWTFLTSGNIRLEHLRFGKDKPVFLVEFLFTKENAWKSIEPHNCNNDLYSAKLSMNDENILLYWSVKGPTENYSLKNIYSH